CGGRSPPGRRGWPCGWLLRDGRSERHAVGAAACPAAAPKSRRSGEFPGQATNDGVLGPVGQNKDGGRNREGGERPQRTETGQRDRSGKGGRIGEFEDRRGE